MGCEKIILVAPCAHVLWDQKFKLCSDSFRTKEINYCFSCYAAPAKVLDHMFLWGKLNSNPRVNETGVASYSTILQGICKHFLPAFIQTATMFKNFLQLYLIRNMGMCSALELTTPTVKLWKLWKSTLKMKVCLPFPLICCHHKASTDSRSRNRWYWVQAWTRNTCTWWHTNRNKDTQTYRAQIHRQKFPF